MNDERRPTEPPRQSPGAHGATPQARTSTPSRRARLLDCSEAAEDRFTAPAATLPPAATPAS